MKPLLFLIRPLRLETRERIDVRLGDADEATYYGMDGKVWEPAINQRPTTSIETMSPDMDGTVQTAKAKFAVQMGQIFEVAKPTELYWQSAAVTIWSLDTPDWSRRAVEFTGVITKATLDLDRMTMAIECEVSSALIEKPLLTLEFDGSSGLGGDPDLRGTLRPAGFGYVENIEPVWFDLTRNIGQIDGYHNTISIDWLAEGLSSFGASVGDYPTYDALAAAIDAHVVPPGRWASCVAEGLVGLGAPPVGVITCHAHFGSGRCGAMMRRMLLVMLGIDAGIVDEDSFNALDAELDYPAHYWTKDQRQVNDLLQAIAGSCNATPILSLQGMIGVTRAVLTDPILTFNRNGSTEPRVTTWKTASTDPPYWQIKARVARPARVMSFDEVNYINDLIDRGLYNNDTVYRPGNMVWLQDGSQWLYINTTPDKGHSPASIEPPDVEDDWWQMLKPSTKANDITYVDGTPIEDLKPAEVGANPTETHVAAAIDGQGDLATDDTVNEDTIDDNSVSRGGYFYNDFTGIEIPYTDTWVDVTDGTFWAEIAIAAGHTESQFVTFQVVMCLNRAGSADDDCQVRIMRTNDSVQIGDAMQFSIQGQNFSYVFAFVDDDPILDTTNTYRLQLNSEANSHLRQFTFLGTLLKK